MNVGQNFKQIYKSFISNEASRLYSAVLGAPIDSQDMHVRRASLKEINAFAAKSFDQMKATPAETADDVRKIIDCLGVIKNAVIDKNVERGFLGKLWFWIRGGYNVVAETSELIDKMTSSFNRTIKTVEYFVHKGDKYAKAKRPEKAVGFYRQAIAWEENNGSIEKVNEYHLKAAEAQAEYYCDRGMECENSANGLPEAIKWFTKAKQLCKPDYYQCKIDHCVGKMLKRSSQNASLGKFNEHGKNFDVAIKFYTTALLYFTALGDSKKIEKCQERIDACRSKMEKQQEQKI